MLKDPGREINLHTFTQLTPVPAAVVALAKEDTSNDYLLQWSGLAVTIGSLMASNLQASEVRVVMTLYLSISSINVSLIHVHIHLNPIPGEAQTVYRQ
jgi:hypothetical protein